MSDDAVQQQDFKPRAWMAVSREGSGCVLGTDRDTVHWDGQRRASYSGVGFDAAYRMVPLHDPAELLAVSDADLDAMRTAYAVAVGDPIQAALDAYLSRRMPRPA